MSYEVTFTEVPERHLVVKRFDADFNTIGQQMGQAFEDVMHHCRVHHLRTQGPAYGVYEMGAGGWQAAAGFPLTEGDIAEGDIAPYDLPAGRVATTVHNGPYEKLHEAYEALKEAALAGGEVLDESVMWEEYWTPPGVPAERQRTVVYWPLR